MCVALFQPHVRGLGQSSVVWVLTSRSKNIHMFDNDNFYQTFITTNNTNNYMKLF